MLFQIRNLLRRSNIRMHPEKDFNVSEDVYDYYCSNSDNPQKSIVSYSTWLEASDAERKALLISVATKIVGDSVFFCFTSQDKVMEYSKFLLGLGCFYRPSCCSISTTFCFLQQMQKH